MCSALGSKNHGIYSVGIYAIFFSMLQKDLYLRCIHARKEEAKVAAKAAETGGWEKGGGESQKKLHSSGMLCGVRKGSCGQGQSAHGPAAIKFSSVERGAFICISLQRATFILAGCTRQEEHRQEGSSVDAVSYWDPNGPLHNAHGFQQGLDLNAAGGAGRPGRVVGVKCGASGLSKYVFKKRCYKII